MSPPDVTGFPWDEALEMLESTGFRVVDTLITGPVKIGKQRRVVRQKLLANNQVALVIAYPDPGTGDAAK